MYYKLLAHIPPLEVLSHRTLWSMVFFGVILAVRGRLGAVWVAMRNRTLLIGLLASAVTIGINWGVFITAIQFDRAIEASLGYYIFPLFVVLLAFVFFKEKFSRIQGVSIALIVIAVLVLTFGLGAPPWISLILAVSFSMYAILKKRLIVGPTVSVFIEVVLLLPIALIWLYGVHLYGWTITDRPAGWFGSNWPDTVLLIFTGPLTAGPLILLSAAAQKVNLSTVGLLQYLNPTSQFLVAALVFSEPVTRWHMIALPVIWVALGLYSLEMWRREQAIGSRPQRGG